MKGTIICIEGVDGCGKQTQANKLYNYLQSKNIEVYMQSFPNYNYDSSVPVKMYLSGEFGDNANCLDAYQASVLFGVDRLLTYNKFLRDKYENGAIIILDRYVTSNMVHQAGKIKDDKARQEFLYWVAEFEYGKLKLPKPDIVFFLDMPVEFSINLASKRTELKNQSHKDIHEQNISHLINAHDCGLAVAIQNGWNLINCVENNQLLSIDNIFEKILKKLTQSIKELTL